MNKPSRFSEVIAGIPVLILLFLLVLPVSATVGMAVTGNLDFYIEAGVETSELKTFRVINTGSEDLNITIAISDLNYTGTLSNNSVNFIINPVQFTLQEETEKVVEVKAVVPNSGSERGGCVGRVYVKGIKIPPEQGQGTGTMSQTLKFNLTLGNPLVHVGTVTGLVVDNETSKPVKGADISFGDRHILTDQNGVYEVTLPIGEYKFYVTYPNYHSQSGTVFVEEGMAKHINLRLAPIDKNHTEPDPVSPNEQNNSTEGTDDKNGELTEDENESDEMPLLVPVILAVPIVAVISFFYWRLYRKKGT